MINFANLHWNFQFRNSTYFNRIFTNTYLFFIWICICSLYECEYVLFLYMIVNTYLFFIWIWIRTSFLYEYKYIYVLYMNTNTYLFFMWIRTHTCSLYEYEYVLVLYTMLMHAFYGIIYPWSSAGQLLLSPQTTEQIYISFLIHNMRQDSYYFINYLLLRCSVSFTRHVRFFLWD